MSENFISLKKSGDEKFQEGKYEESIEFYNNALKEENKQDEHKVILNRCLAKYKLGNYETALEDAVLSCQLKQDSAKSWGRVGSCLLALKREEESKIAFDRAYQLDPTNEEFKKLSGKDLEKEDKTEDEQEDELINKMKNLKMENMKNEELLNKLKNMKDSNFIENLPLDGMMGNLFKKMMNNEKLIQMASDEDFEEKLLAYKKNPFEAMKNPVFLELMNDFIKELK